MGVHQFKLNFVPPGVVISRDEDGSYAGGFLASFPISVPLVERLRQLFKKTNHWGQVEEYLSEKEWSSDLRIFRSEGGEIDDVELRFAPIADSVEILRDFVAIAKEAGCFLLIKSSGAVVAPDFEEILQFLRADFSMRFLSDPKDAIIQAARKLKENG